VKLLNAVLKHIQLVCLKGLLLLVRTYQLILSPVLGSQCRYFPSCSHYCQEALHEHGIGKGLLLTIKRILRCHPGCKGGFDPVPKKSLSHG
jgi:putative membrane protein insertion efficiency factor